MSIIISLIAAKIEEPRDMRSTAKRQNLWGMRTL